MIINRHNLDGIDWWCWNTVPLGLVFPAQLDRKLSFTFGNITQAAFPMVDMMLQMQRLGMRAMTMYQPIASAFIESALTPQSSGSAVTRRRSTETHNSAIMEQPPPDAAIS